MTATEYQGACTLIAAVARVVEGIDLAGVLWMMERAETLGPFVDPTLYRDFLGDRKAQLDWNLTGDLARTLLEVQKIVRKAKVQWEDAESAAMALRHATDQDRRQTR